MSGPVTLIEVRPLDPATGAEQVLRFSAGVQGASVYDGEFWDDRLLSEASTGMDIFEEEFEETGSQPAIGQIVLAAGDARIDSDLLLAWAGSKVKVWTGNEDDAFAAFTLEYEGAAEDLIYDEGRASIRLFDRSIHLDKPLDIPVYAGGGGAEGGDDLVGKRKMCVFGPAIAVQPDLVDAVNLIYQVHFRKINAINLVTDQAVPLTFSGNDVADYTALVALSVPEGQYATALAVGMLKTGRRPVGLFVVDLDGDAEATYVSSGAKIIERIIDANLVPDFAAADRDQPSFDAVEAANSAPIAIVVPREANASEVFDAIMRSYGGFWQVTDLGKIAIDIIGFGASVATLTEDDILSIRSLETSPPVWSLGLDYEPVWRVHRGGEFNPPLSDEDLPAGQFAWRLNTQAGGTASNIMIHFHGFGAYGLGDTTVAATLQAPDGTSLTLDDATTNASATFLVASDLPAGGYYVLLDATLANRFALTGASSRDLAVGRVTAGQWQYASRDGSNNHQWVNFSPDGDYFVIGTANYSGSAFTAFSPGAMTLEAAAELTATFGADFLGNLTNKPEDSYNLWIDPLFDLTTSIWAAVDALHSIVADPLGTPEYTNVVKMDADSSNNDSSLITVPVKEGDTLFIDFDMLKDGSVNAGADAGVYVQWRKYDGSSISNDTHFPDESGMSTAVWTTFSKAHVAPALAVKARITISNRSSHTAGSLYMANLRALKNELAATDNSDALDGQLLLDGATIEQAAGGSARVLTQGMAGAVAFDTDTFIFDPTREAVPLISWGAGGLSESNTLTAPVWRNFQALLLTTGGFTASLRLSEVAGSTTMRTETGATTGGTYDYEMNKDETADQAFDDNYNYQTDVSVNAADGPEPSTVTVAYLANNGAGWVEKATKIFVNITASTKTFLNNHKVINHDGMDLNDDWAVDVKSTAGNGGSITAFDNVIYESAAGAPSDESATPTGVSGVAFEIKSGEEGTIT